MNARKIVRASFLAILGMAPAAHAQISTGEPLRLAETGQDTKTPNRDDDEKKEDLHEYSPAGDTDEFFNIREANPRVEKGEWELEMPFAWSTRSNHQRDDLNLSTELSYGVTDDASVEIEVLPITLGQGGDQGNGDLGLTLFNRFVRESGNIPAVAGWIEMRIPCGQGSSGVDAELHAAITKTIAPKFRAHVEGFVETANGGRGEEDRDDHRPFQWGLGPGFDYQFTDRDVAVLNYLNRTSDQRGEHNENLLQIGAYHLVSEHQTIKAGIEIGLDGQRETSNFGFKIQYEIEWGDSDQRKSKGCI
jgi:hypothetical protein